MKKNYKRIVTLGLALVISIQAIPIATYAQSNNDELINIDYAYHEIQSLSPKQLSEFKEAFNKSLKEDGINLYEENDIKTRGVKSKAAKVVAKKMSKKLYKIGSKSFNKAIRAGAKKLPKSIGDKIIKNVTYSRISTILNIVANVEGTITDAIANQLDRFLPSGIANIASRLIVFILV